jgi:hypothetical protein
MSSPRAASAPGSTPSWLSAAHAMSPARKVASAAVTSRIAGVREPPASSDRAIIESSTRSPTAGPTPSSRASSGTPPSASVGRSTNTHDSSASATVIVAVSTSSPRSPRGVRCRT